jgi:hypothetical protein
VCGGEYCGVRHYRHLSAASIPRVWGPTDVLKRNAGVGCDASYFSNLTSIE